jgi:amidase
LRLPEPTVASVSGLRVAAWFDEPALEIDAEMATVLHAAAAALEAAGARVDRMARPSFDVHSTWRMLAKMIGVATSVSDEDDRGVSHRDWLFLHRRRAEVRAAWAQLFESFDVVLCPVTIVPAFEHLQAGDWRERRLTINGVDRSYIEVEGWPALVGGAYLPSTSTPVGRTPGGLPVGVQVVAPNLHDHTAIKVAGWLADLMGGWTPPPIVR